MKICYSLSFVLIIGLALLFSCSSDEVAPDASENGISKIKSSTNAINPVQYFIASSMVDLENPPPFPVMIPQGNKLKISATLYTIVSSDCQFVNGYMITNMEGLWDENMTGPVSGEFTIDQEEGSYWKGQVHGKRHKIDESTWQWKGHFIGKGYGPQINGMKIMFIEEITTHELQASVLESTLEGKIIIPPTSATTH